MAARLCCQNLSGFVGIDQKNDSHFLFALCGRLQEALFVCLVGSMLSMLQAESHICLSSNSLLVSSLSLVKPDKPCWRAQMCVIR